MAIAPIGDTIGGWLFVAFVALVVFASVMGGSTLNMARGFGPFFVNRRDHPTYYWLSIAFMSAFLLAGIAGMIAFQFNLLGWDPGGRGCLAMPAGITDVRFRPKADIR